MQHSRQIALNQGNFVLATRRGFGISKWKFKGTGDGSVELEYELSPTASHRHMVYDENHNGWTLTNNVYYFVDMEKRQINRMTVLFYGTMFHENYSKKVLLFSDNVRVKPAITPIGNGYKELSFVSNDEQEDDECEYIAYAIDFSADAICKVKIITLR